MRTFIRVLLILFIPVTAMSQTRQDVRDEFAKLGTDPEFLAQMVSFFQVGPELEPVFLNHAKELYNNDEVIDFMADGIFAQIKDAPTDSQRNEELFFLNAGAELTQTASLSGVHRLDISDQRTMVEHSSSIFSVMDVNVCGQIAAGDITPIGMAKAESRALASLTPDHVERYLALLRRGLLAEIRGNPEKKVITPRAAKDAQAALSKMLDTKFGAHPNGAKIQEVMAGQRQPTSELLCDFILVYFDAVLSIPGDAGDTAVMVMLRQ